MDGTQENRRMEHDPARIAGVSQPAPPPTPPRREQLCVVYGTPPPAAREEFGVAAQVINDLASRQISLHLEVDHDAGKVRVEVLNGDGAVVREISARSLLDTLSGGGLLIDVRG
jgi:hypothetical protein